jgi:CheY-like chemotaxis protein
MQEKILQKKNEETILIIDDDRDIGEALQCVIDAETPYRTLWIAESDLALLSAPHLRPALILLDYLMPLMDGLVLYDRLQEVPGMQGVPVLLISAATSLPYEQLRQRNIRLLRKPFDVPDLLQMIDEMVDR